MTSFSDTAGEKRFTTYHGPGEEAILLHQVANKRSVGVDHMVSILVLGDTLLLVAENAEAK